MKCCYGLVRTDVDDLKFLLSEQFNVYHEEVPKLKGSPLAVLLGVKTASRNLQRLATARVLILESAIRLRGYSMEILDKEGPVEASTLATALAKTTPQVMYRAPGNIIRKVLKQNADNSVLTPFLNIKYKTTDAVMQAKFDAAFLTALGGDVAPLRKLAPKSSLKLIEWIESDEGYKLKQALSAVGRGVAIELAAQSFGVPAFDLRYLTSRSVKLRK